MLYVFFFIEPNKNYFPQYYIGTHINPYLIYFHLSFRYVFFHEFVESIINFVVCQN